MSNCGFDPARAKLAQSSAGCRTAYRDLFSPFPAHPGPGALGAGPLLRSRIRRDQEPDEGPPVGGPSRRGSCSTSAGSSNVPCSALATLGIWILGAVASTDRLP